MDRLELIRSDCKQTLTRMNDEIDSLLRFDIYYLDSQRTAEPTTGLELYERFDRVRATIRREFPQYGRLIPIRNYEVDAIGGLRNDDLCDLKRDIDELLRILNSN